MNTPALSVLDLVPVRSGQTSAQSVAASMKLATLADELGYRRYWFAEHHNMPAVASTSPPVLISAAAARTSQIRLGSGGVMLPNHSPLIVAEQFAALSALYPDRIDLGLGRAPGSDPVITQLLRQSGNTSDVERFPEHVRDILHLMQPLGSTVHFTSGGEYTVKATPDATTVPTTWLLGSSDYSAQLAASFGLPYVFANHFSSGNLERVLDIYRSTFQPSEYSEKPKTFLTVNTVAADTEEEAHERALPQLRMMVRLMTNKPLIRLETVDQAKAGIAEEQDVRAQSIMDGAIKNYIVGTGEQVRSELSAFATRYDVDEVMIVPVAGGYDGEDATTSTGRDTTLTLAAGR